MNRPLSPILFLVSLAVSACGGGGDKPPAPAAAKATPAASTQQGVLVANNLNNDAWSKGVRTGAGSRNVFMFIAEDPGKLPIRPGSKLVFARAGEALVKDVAPSGQTKPTTVFVVVDRDLDPIGDGFPNPVTIK